MNGWLIGYVFCAALMFAWLAFPPFKHDQENQGKAFEYVLERHGRTGWAYVWLGCIVVSLSAIWPIVLVAALLDVGSDMEFYE
jgi:hypothetical protein